MLRNCSHRCLLIAFLSGLEDGAGFEERLDPVPATFPADAGVFEATPGRLRIVGHAIEHDPTVRVCGV